MSTRFHRYLPALLAPIALLRAADTPFLDYPAALALAKSSGKDIVLFQDGSDWAPESAGLNTALAAPEIRKKLGERVIWAREDHPNAPTPPEPKDMPKPDFRSWNLPALLVISPEGRTHAIAEGLSTARVPSVVAGIPAALDARAKHDTLLKQAGAAAGTARAKLLGAALDALPFDFAAKRKDLRDEIKKADPQDESGYTFKYGFDRTAASSFHEHTLGKLIGEKKYAEALALCDARLKNPVLTPNQRQIIMAGRFQTHRAADDLPKALAELKAIIAVSPATDMARGAAEYYRDHAAPVKLKRPAWEPEHNAPAWFPFVLDVSKIITTPGAYDIEFKHRAGHTRFRRATLLAGKTELAVEENTKEQRKIRLTVTALPANKREPVELRVESRGTGWFDGAGDILITKEH